MASSSILFSGLSGLPQEDRVLLSRFGRGPALKVPHATIHEAFESIADSHPRQVAARFNGQSITYQELDLAANQLANYLIASRLQPRQRVCLVVQRSITMLVGILAILKAGCQYVPVDGGVCSAEAMAHIFQDTGAQFILCLSKLEGKVRQNAGSSKTIVLLDSKLEASFSEERPRIHVKAQDGAYAIYTSGTTGKPKGVDVMHSNVTNALLLEPASLGITVGTKVAQVLNVAFDMGAWEVIACLMNGGTLFLRGSDWMETLRKVDTLISTPTILSKFPYAELQNIKTVVCGGEPCPQALADEWAQTAVFYNICGPTEITILNTAHKHNPGMPLSIGRPLPNTTLYVLDENMEPVPVGSKGVMWVGGAGVSRGYINLPELSATRYKIDKFANDGSMMFNTGDIVQWRADGSVNTFGRADDQVKLKVIISQTQDDVNVKLIKPQGFRVELDGVTAVVEKFPSITHACAIVIDGTLCSFYTASIAVDETVLDAFVKRALPYYSVPERWYSLTKMPMTPNGKVDKKQLRELAVTYDSSSDIASNSDNSSIETRVGGLSRVLSDQSGATVVGKADSLISKNSEKDLRVATNLPKDQHSSSTDVSEFGSSSGDIEKDAGIVTLVHGDGLDVPTTAVVEVEKPDSLPSKNGFHGQRWVRHRFMILYRKFFSFVVMANIAAAILVIYLRISNGRPMLADLATATATNICVAILMRSEPVVNLLFTIFCSVPHCFPLVIRRYCAQIFHIGGIHSGCALSATMWFGIFAIEATIDFAKGPGERSIRLASIVLTYLVLLLFVAMASSSHPKFRVKYHNIWEATHRFGGWTALILIWIQAFLTTKDLSAGQAPSQAYLHSPPVWLLTIATMAIIFPWLHLRKVPVRSEVLSSHAIRLHFDYTTPVVGTAVRLAERPLVDWHGFATITNANGKGFSVIVSNAGDFTKRTIDRAPTQIWVRGIPTCGVLRICTAFKSVVLVATGSGIGPCLAVILAKKTPARILWTAPNPEVNFGQGIIDAVKEKDPHAVIHNTKTMGKPNMALMAYQLWKESGAEAVCVISNKSLTTKVVYAMEARGIPAYGAIFDS